ncbi:hypothetical protein B0H66DRAFT_546306 [Apodospora peruviana]|uniref:Very-long-chain 3-oxoacyl-CoA synthase n=1 Tax=Apodospora peruviana TaxID=516989 RepID=A0AAE0IUQ2_9PEZI|nr:hypothetical protein B0H66DRAFT_546306 [Apodospora peruviana]
MTAHNTPERSYLWQPDLLGMITATLAFTTIWSGLNVFVKLCGGGPLPGASTFTRYNSRLYSLLSYGLLVVIVRSWPSSSQSYRTTTAEWLYHMSKFYEYIDIFNVIASGGTVSLHFGWHHLTTSWLTWARVLPSTDTSIGGSNNEGWRWFAAANAVHHVLMYAYFGGLGAVRPLLPYTGQIQLILGILVDVWIIYKRVMKGVDGHVVVWPYVFSMGLLSTYLVLNSRELAAAERVSRKKRVKDTSKEV